MILCFFRGKEIKITIFKNWLLFFSVIILIFVCLACQKAEDAKKQYAFIDPILLLDGNDVSILADGMFSQGEWDDALSFKVDKRVTLLFKSKKGHLFFSRYDEPGEISNIYWVDSRVIEEARKNVYPLSEKQILKGHYLGQKPPGITPESKIPGSCTIFAASFGNTVLYGNNEDYRIPKTYYWTEASGEKTYAGVFVGFDNFFPQGGINEKGLAFDFNALPEAPLNPHTELPERGDIIKKIYQTCATVEEAIALIKKHNWGSSIRWQVLLADATGDAVVISAGPDGELAFTRKPKGDGYLVSTNFNRANSKNTYRGGYPCWRYNKAVEMLEKIKDERDLTVDYFKSILDACHVEGPGGNTLYSNVFDLRNGVIYLYHWHQFYETAVLNVADEITKKKPPTLIKELFSQETVKRAEDEYQRYREKK